MKIAVRGGHNAQATGAKGLIDEYTEDRKVCAAVVKYLKILNQDVINVSPGPMSSSSDLAYGVNKATDFGSDLFVSIHFNNAYDNYNGALGTETIIYPNSAQAKPYATRVNDGIVKLGFKNRGVKNDTRGLYELRNTKCPALIVEVCFVEATEDVKLYNKLGPDAIGKTIAEAIVGQTVNEKPNYTVNYCLEFQKWYNEVTKTKAPLKEDGIFGENTEKAINTITNIIKNF